MTTRIYFNGTRAGVRRQVDRLRLMLAGREADTLGIAVGFSSAIGFGALSDIKDAFVTKTRDGGTDDMGIRWPPLKPETIARRRVGDGDLKTPTIKLREDVKNRYLRSKEAKALRARLTLSLGAAKANERVRQIAGQLTTSKTGTTRVEALGYRDVDILRDTGVLFNSLSPGQVAVGPGNSYQKPTGKGGDHQIFKADPARVVVGTNVPYAKIHDKGGGKIPRRQILPDNGGQVPKLWWGRWLAIGAQSLEAGAAILFGSL